MPYRALMIPALPRVVCALCLALGAAFGASGWGGGTMREGIAESLRERGLAASPDDVRAVGRPRGAMSGALGYRPVLALAGLEGRGRDLYYLEVRVSPSGRVLSVRRTTNLTRTPAADEADLAVHGWWAAYATRTENGYEAVTLLDLEGEPRELTRGWSPFWRAAIAITRYQETGRLEGIGRTRYTFSEPARRLRLSLGGEGLAATTERGRLRVPRAGAEPTGGLSLAKVQHATRGQPGLLGWTVDTVRDHAWVGPERIAWLEHVFFGVVDLGRRGYYAVRAEETAAEIEAELGLPPPEAAEIGEAPPPEVGFPPPRTDTVRTPRLEGEGIWMPVRDEFVRQQPGLGPIFYTTWLRADPERSYARVVLTVWDPRRVQMGLRAGTHEPVGDTGLAGDGMIPRDRRLLKRLVAAFNGGFQAKHGEYGVMVDGEALLPPKPWAATIAMLSGGRTGLGTWPGDRTEIPEEIVAYRQNMTVLVLDGVLDPYRRPWWGSAPPGAEDPTHTIRTAVCLTEEGFMLYAWGTSLTHETLAATLIAARCGYAVHLDLNSGHSGFEFYDVTDQAEALPLERPLVRSHEAEGTVRGMPDLHFRSRRMVRGMGHMRFPRYIGRDPRDFFYLTLRPVLPGEPLRLPEGGPRPEENEGAFSVRGLPHNGFPYALARTSVRPLPARPEARVFLARIDPQRIALEPGDDAVPLASIAPGGDAGDLALVARPGDVGPELAIEPASSASGSVVLRGALLSGSRATAGIGVDPDGRLVWAEGPDAQAIGAALALAEVFRAIGLEGDDPHFEFRYGDRVARLDGRPPVAETDPRVTVYGVDRPLAMRLFPEVEIVPPRVWYPRQAKRVRYFREPADAGPGDAGPGDADAGAAAVPAPGAAPDAGPAAAQTSAPPGE